MLDLLIKADLTKITTEHTVASEETIRFFIDYFEKNGQLINPLLIHADDVIPFFNHLINHGESKYGRYQLISLLSLTLKCWC